MTPAVPPAGQSLRFRERVRMRVGSAELLVFGVGQERFAIELRSVEEVVDAPSPRAVAGAAPGLLGVFAHGERLLPLYDPTAALGVAAVGGAHALVMRAGAARIGLAVDDAHDVVTCNMADLRPPPHGMGDDLLVGVLLSGETLVGVLDARALTSACIAGPIPTEL